MTPTARGDRAPDTGPVTAPGADEAQGRFVLVLHTHLPWLKGAGGWPVGEEWLFQAWGEAYLPLLDVLESQAAKGHEGLLTLGLTPLIVQQMDDPGLLERFEEWLRFAVLRCETLAANAGQWPGEFDARREAAAYWRRWYQGLLDRFVSYGRRLLPGFREVLDAGVVEVLGGPLSHPYLPLHDDETVLAQTRLGLDEAERLLGRRPRGIWLPECAYRPGIETPLEAAGVEYLVLDGPSLLACGVPNTLRRAWSLGESRIVTVGRDLEVAYRVWSPTGGYPGGGAYREYHWWEWDTGLKLKRVTDKTVEGPDKAFYDETLALAATERDVADFAGLLRSSIGDGDVVVACYDTELFGHWWYEGPAWLDRLLDTLVRETTIVPTTLGNLVDEAGPAGRLTPPAGSWGLGKDFSIWDNEGTEGMWGTLGDLHTVLRERLDSWAAHSSDPETDDLRQRLLVQGYRELALADSSDWPFMIGHDKSVEYAHERFEAHAEAARRCFDAMTQVGPGSVHSPAWLVELEERDDLHPGLTADTLVRAHTP